MKLWPFLRTYSQINYKCWQEFQKHNLNQEAYLEYFNGIITSNVRGESSAFDDADSITMKTLEYTYRKIDHI